MHLKEGEERTAGSNPRIRFSSGGPISLDPELIISCFFITVFCLRHMFRPCSTFINKTTVSLCFFLFYSFYVLLLHLPPLRYSYTVSEDAEIEPRTVAMFSLAISGLSNRLDLIQLSLPKNIIDARYSLSFLDSIWWEERYILPYLTHIVASGD